MSDEFLCGHKDEWEFFSKQYDAVIPALTKLHAVLLSSLEKAKTPGPSEHVMAIIGWSCLREFEEIVLLSGNGYGGGATKLLRSFYERVVTLSYLNLKPDKVEQFTDYSAIHWNKLLKEAEAIHADTPALSEESKAQLEKHYEENKARYEQSTCSKCKCEHKRIQMSWTKAPVPQQAADVDDNLRKLCFNAYLRPTLFVHTTFLGMMSQIELLNEQHYVVSSVGKEREAVAEVLNLAHLLALQALIVINSYFKLGRDTVLEELGKEWGDNWIAVNKPPDPNDALVKELLKP